MRQFLLWLQFCLLIFSLPFCRSDTTDVVLFGVGNLGKSVVLKLLQQRSPQIRIVAAFRKQGSTLSDSNGQSLWPVASVGPHEGLKKKYHKGLNRALLDGVRVYPHSDFEEWFSSSEYGSSIKSEGRPKLMALVCTESGGQDLFTLLSRLVKHGLHVITSAQQLFHLSLTDMRDDTKHNDQAQRHHHHSQKHLSKLQNILSLAKQWRLLNQQAMEHKVSVKVIGLQQLWLSELNKAESKLNVLESLRKEESVMISVECNADLVSEYWLDYMIGERPVDFQEQARNLQATLNLDETIQSFLYWMSDLMMIDDENMSISRRRIRYSSVPLTDFTGDSMSLYLMRGIETNRITGVTYSGRLTWDEQSTTKKNEKKSPVNHREISLFVKLGLLNRWQRKDKSERESMQPCRISFDLDDDGQPELQVNRVQLWDYVSESMINSTLEGSTTFGFKVNHHGILDNNDDAFWSALDDRISNMETSVKQLEKIVNKQKQDL